MSETPAEEPTSDVPAEESAKDYQAEFAAQQKINRDLERRTKSDKAKLDALTKELAQLREGAKKHDNEPTIDQIREATRAEVLAEAMNDRVLDKIEARAARDFQHPEDVSAFLRSRAQEFLDGSTIDLEAIDDALTDLKTARPGWLVSTDDRAFKGSADGGVKREKQLSVDEQIAAAEQAGNFTESMRLKTANFFQP